VTERTLRPRSRAFPQVKPNTWPPRVPRDIRWPLAAFGTRSVARAPRHARPRCRFAADCERAFALALAGTQRCTPAASTKLRAQARTSSGTRCIGGTSPSLALRCPSRAGVDQWINIPPLPSPGSPRPLDQEPAVRWIRPRPPLKISGGSRCAARARVEPATERAGHLVALVGKDVLGAQLLRVSPRPRGTRTDRGQALPGSRRRRARRWRAQRWRAQRSGAAHRHLQTKQD
jgi:hypothetical protein